MPKFEANMNYIPPSPPSSMKQSNKSVTVKFHMELLLTTTTRKQSRSGATPVLKSCTLPTELWGSDLKVEEQPQCIPCSAPFTIQHVLVDCLDLAPTRQRLNDVNNMATL